MAAASGREAPLRLRLFFDYPPPGSPACGSCWLLLEPSQVRLVTDLISLVREKFGFSRHAKLSLFLDGALLPPTESARLVRDNDSLRVKLEEVIGGDSCDKLTNGCSHASKKLKKQYWERFETSDSESDEEEHRKQKKSKHHIEHLSTQKKNSTNVLDSVTFRKKEKTVTEKDGITSSNSDDSMPPLKKLRKGADTEKEWVTKRDKKKKGRNFEAKDTSQKTKNISPMRHSHKSTTANTKKGGKSSDSSTSSSDSDDNIADTKEKHSHKTKVASKQINKSQPASSVKSVFPTKLAAKQNDKRSLRPPISKMASIHSSNSDSSSSSGEEEEQQSSNLKNKLPLKAKEIVTAAVTAPASKTKPDSSSSDSDSSGSGSFTVKKPKTSTEASRSFGEDGGKQLFASTFGLKMNSSDNVRGRGRGESPFWRGSRVRGCQGLVRGRGRGRSENPNFNYNYNNEYNKQQQLNEAATNTSVIIQDFGSTPITVDGSTFPVLAGMPTTNREDTCTAINAAIPLDAPKKDYSKLPLLAAPPQVGEKIAFKVLELTESYTPEVSDYKEAKIISWDPAIKQLELELLSFSSVAKEPGKFDLVYESANGAETIEYAVSQDRKVTENWDALIEPRLLVDLPNKELSSKTGTPSDVNTLVLGVNSL